MTVTIDARPFPFKLNKQAAAFIIIDMQRDFVEPGGFGESLGNDVRPLQAIVPVVGRLLDGFRQQDMHIIHTRESHLPDLSDCPTSKLNRGSPSLRIGDKGPMGRILVQGEHGTGIVDELLPTPEEIVIDKPGKGAFYATDLDAISRNLGINQFIFAGVTTEVCVQTTMREANDRGYECLLATDATESYFPEFKKATIDMIEAQGAIVGWTATTDQILEAISG